MSVTQQTTQTKDTKMMNATWNLVTRESRETVETITAESYEAAVAKFEQLGWNLNTRKGPSKFIITME